MRLCHTERQVCETKFGKLLDLGLSFGRIIDTVGAIDLATNDLDLLFDGEVQLVKEFEFTGLYR